MSNRRKMGLFNRKSKDNSQKQDTKGYTVINLQYGAEMKVYDFENKAEIQGDRGTTLITAKTQKRKTNKDWEKEDNIAFEINSGYEVDQQVAEALVRKYLNVTKLLDNSEECLYMGRLCKDTQTGMLYFGQKSQQVHEYVRSIIDPKIQQERTEQEKEEKSSKKDDFKKAISQGLKDVQPKEQERRERKQADRSDNQSPNTR